MSRILTLFIQICMVTVTSKALAHFDDDTFTSSNGFKLADDSLPIQAGVLPRRSLFGRQTYNPNCPILTLACGTACCDYGAMCCGNGCCAVGYSCASTTIGLRCCPLSGATQGVCAGLSSSNPCQDSRFKLCVGMNWCCPVQTTCLVDSIGNPVCASSVISSSSSPLLPSSVRSTTSHTSYTTTSSRSRERTTTSSSSNALYTSPIPLNGSSSKSTQKSRLSSGKIGAIAGGGAVGLGMLIIVVWIYISRKCKNKGSSNDDTDVATTQKEPKDKRTANTLTLVEDPRKFPVGLVDDNEVPRFYRNLEPGVVRLVILKEGEAGAPIKCVLVEQYLRSANLFDALSWVWYQRPRNLTDEDADPSLERLDLFSPDGHKKPAQFRVTWNLMRALRHLRYPKDMGDRLLWIDCLCINQHETLGIIDRDQQLPMMGEIYGSANKVISWLGEKAEDIEIIFQQVNQIGTSLDKGSDYDSKELAAFHGLAQRDYWSRIWIVQEFALAKNEHCIVFKCDHLELDWICLNILVNRVDKPTDRPVHDPIDDYVFIPGVTKLNRTGAIRKFIRPAQLIQNLWAKLKANNTSIDDREPKRNLPLVTLIQDFRNHQCTEPIDRIRAVKELADPEDFEWTDPSYEIHTKYFPKYQSEDLCNEISNRYKALELSPPIKLPFKRSEFAAIVDVYGGLVIVHASRYGRLDMLNYHTGETKDRNLSQFGLPSWIPNLWSSHTMYPLIDGGKGREHSFEFPGLVYTAGTFRRAEAARLGSTWIGVLDVKGFRFDTIEKRLDPFEVPDSSNPTIQPPHTMENLNSMLHEWASRNGDIIEEWDIGAYGNFSGFEIALRRTSIANIDPNRIAFKPGAKVKLDAISFGRFMNEDREFLSSTLADMAQVYPGDVMRVQLNRSLFLTKKGILGVGHKELRVGDTICILYGGQTPYILRPNSDTNPLTWTFIGDCYVHGIMDGEAINGNGWDEIFRLV